MDQLRLATLQEDQWRLLDGEAVHRNHPETFWLPAAGDRRSLTSGTQVKLMFEMEGTEQDGTAETSTERMWVVVTERVGARYLGLLRNQPIAYDPDDETVYVRWGAEVAFGPEHVIDILDEEPVPEADLSQPTRRWAR